MPRFPRGDDQVTDSIRYVKFVRKVQGPDTRKYVALNYAQPY